MTSPNPETESDPTRPDGPDSPDEQGQASSTNGTSARRPGRRPWAMWAAVTDEMLNDIVLMGIGAGVSLDPVEREINLPAMGEVRLRLALTVTGVSFECRADDDGRARVTVQGEGDVSARGTDYEGDEASGAALGMPAPPAPLPVELKALCRPFFDLHEDHSISFGLNLRDAELVSLDVNRDAETPEGVDPDAWTGILNMTSMMFTSVGEDLFAGLGEAVGTVGLDLGSDVGATLVELGVAPGAGDAQVSSGVISIGLPSAEDVEGRAVPVPIAGHRAAVSLASSGVNVLAAKVLERTLGGLPMPFEVELEMADRRIGALLRQPRVVSDRFPDLRATMHTDVAVRLTGGRLEVGLAAAWLELPPVVPSFVNEFNRRVGELWSMAPVRFKLPKQIQVPVGDGDDRIGVTIDDLRVDPSGVGAALALA
ncbi:MAG: hypothetical protein ACK5O2_16855 [Microthrixaceae bacterium]